MPCHTLLPKKVGSAVVLKSSKMPSVWGLAQALETIRAFYMAVAGHEDAPKALGHEEDQQ